MPYEEYSLHDFLKDDFFIRWVLHPDPETNHFWQNWLATYPEKKAVIQSARMFIQHLEYKDKYEISNTQYTRLFEQTIRYKQQQDIIRQDQWRTKSKAIWWSVAAILSLVFLSTTLIHYHTEQKPEKAYTFPMQFVEKETPLGSKYSFVLPDSSVVKLNAGSKLRYPERFEGNSRKVFLEGEAFFEIKRNVTKPFVISTREIETQVLGTSFNIRAYRAEAVNKVAVVSGLVKVITKNGLSSLVDPEQMAVYKKGEKSLRTQLYDKKKEIGWKDNILYFDEIALRKVFSTLEVWYDVHIDVDNSILLNEPYSGEFHNETLRNVLEGIGYTSGFSFAIEEKKVKIFKPKYQ